jgi:hypothetical protein
MSGFVTKDSGERETFATGMQRDTGAKALRPDLIWSPMRARFGCATIPNGDLEQIRLDAFDYFTAWFDGKKVGDDDAALALRGIAMCEEKKASLRLILCGDMLIRWAELMGRGAIKYGERNWEKARTQEELDRFRASAFRHFCQWFYGLNPEEDHAAAVFFNIAGAEYVKQRMEEDKRLKLRPAMVKCRPDSTPPPKGSDDTLPLSEGDFNPRWDGPV